MLRSSALHSQRAFPSKHPAEATGGTEPSESPFHQQQLREKNDTTPVFKDVAVFLLPGLIYDKQANAMHCSDFTLYHTTLCKDATSGDHRLHDNLYF